MADSTTKAQAEQDYIDIILRQTDYTYEIAREKLIEYKNDYRTVIRSYLREGIASANPTTKPLSTNQQIYKEIRSFMDEADLSNTQQTTFKTTF